MPSAGAGEGREGELCLSECVCVCVYAPWTVCTGLKGHVFASLDLDLGPVCAKKKKKVESGLGPKKEMKKDVPGQRLST